VGQEKKELKENIGYHRRNKKIALFFSLIKNDTKRETKSEEKKKIKYSITHQKKKKTFV